MDRLFAKYGDKLRLVVYHVAFDIKAEQANQAALCAGDQGKYWEFRKLLFDRQREWIRYSSLDTPFKDYAREVGLDVSRFTDCLNSDTFQARLASEQRLAKANNVKATPTILVHGQRIVGAMPFEMFDAAVKGALDK